MKVDIFNGFTIRNNTDGLTEDNLVRLWYSVGWDSGSAQVPNRLLTALKNSGAIFTAWDGEKLIGLCSAIDDGLNAWISYMVVDSEYQNSELGGFLLDKMLTKYSEFRIFVQSMNAARFYKKHGFSEEAVSLKLNDMPIIKG